MNFKPQNLKVNFFDEKYAVDGLGCPIFNWSAISDDGVCQTEYRITVFDAENCFWDSGFVKSNELTATYAGEKLPSGSIINWSLQIKDNNGDLSSQAVSKFKTACYDEWQGKWIESPLERDFEAQYFKKKFELKKIPQKAVLFHSGLGIDKAFINNKKTNDYYLSPAFTNYQKECQYLTDIIDVSFLNIGENEIQIIVAPGWRKNYGKFLENMSKERQVEFMGNMCLNAQLVLTFDDGGRQIISTDDTWEVSTGNIIYSHLFNGEVYQENANRQEGNVRYSAFRPEKFVAENVEPISIKEKFKPINSYRINGKTIYDFGENLSGIVQLVAKGYCSSECAFIIRYAEDCDESGNVFTEPLRSALATDKYLCSEGSCNIKFLPEFTYHGFRYIELDIEGDFCGEIEIEAYKFYTDIDAGGFFRCSNPIINEIFNVIVRTEKCNIHSIASDCPQRDERLGWMNDATVRFMNMGYFFHIPNLFEKIIRDVINEQDNEGRITCTAPFIFGEQPADPVCSAFIVAAYEHYLYTGETRIFSEYYDCFVKWVNFLKSCEIDGIVNYSYYGDWAGPEKYCTVVKTIGNTDTEVLEGFEPGAAHSKFVPGTMVSTGISFLNYRILAHIAKILNKKDDEELFKKQVDRIQKAYLDKWVRDGKVFNGTQGCQAFSLYIGIIPDEQVENAVRLLKASVDNGNKHIQVGNIIAPMVYETLGKYGYVDCAWDILCSLNYPSIGHMIANGATTVWERYESKKDAGMNSHNHPMHGSVAGFIYRTLLGFKVLSPNKKYQISPSLPKDLSYLEMKVPLLCDSIYIKIAKSESSTNIIINVPFGMEIVFELNGQKCILGSGLNSIKQ